ncbi:Intracellular chorismate mutase [Mycobacteroides abscessus subsp. abscessus]|nr:Intracellular chorismate mutase [Mycobacteroides abscessus subsp. abscessus]
MTTHMTEKASQGSGDPTLDIDELRKEIDRLDAEILAAIKRRPRLVHSREMKVLERYSELGQEGHTLAMLLLRLGRGRLGH